MRALIIEDYPPLLKALTKGLKESGFAVDVSPNGEEGLWFAESNEYDIIILDLMLPGKSGLDILKELRRQGNNIPILILTARDSVDDRVKGLDLGADDYLAKPFSFDELLARIRALIRRSYTRKNPVITIANLEIQTTSKQVFRDGKLIELTPREYALLEYLAFREGEVISRTDIWEHVYAFHDEGTSNVIDVYIGYLRKKIDKDFDLKLIHTRRGVGYWIGISQNAE